MDDWVQEEFGDEQEVRDQFELWLRDVLSGMNDDIKSSQIRIVTDPDYVPPITVPEFRQVNLSYQDQDQVDLEATAMVLVMSMNVVPCFCS